jgi:hypothetical protein
VLSGSFYPGYGALEGSREHSNELPGCIKHGECTGYLVGHRLDKNYSATWSYLVQSWGSSVSISDYRLDHRGSIPAEAKEFSSSLCVQTSSGAHPASLPRGTGGPFPGVKRGWGVKLTIHLHLVPRSRMTRSYSLLPLGAKMAVAGQLHFFFSL